MLTAAWEARRLGFLGPRKKKRRALECLPKWDFNRVTSNWGTNGWKESYMVTPHTHSQRRFERWKQLNGSTSSMATALIGIQEEKKTNVPAKVACVAIRRHVPLILWKKA
jgi:hypothetical protein